MGRIPYRTSVPACVNTGNVTKALGGASMYLSITERTCAECGETKPISEFKRDGVFLSTACQDCRSTWIELPYATKSEMKAERLATNRAAKYSCEGTITAYEWMDLKKKYNYTCLRCGKKEPEIKLTLDHVVPLIVGGKNIIENAQPLCKPCNSSKYTKSTDYRF